MYAAPKYMNSASRHPQHKACHEQIFAGCIRNFHCPLKTSPRHNFACQKEICPTFNFKADCCESISAPDRAVSAPYTIVSTQQPLSRGSVIRNYVAQK